MNIKDIIESFKLDVSCTINSGTDRPECCNLYKGKLYTCDQDYIECIYRVEAGTKRYCSYMSIIAGLNNDE